MIQTKTRHFVLLLLFSFVYFWFVSLQTSHNVNILVRGFQFVHNNRQQHHVVIGMNSNNIQQLFRNHNHKQQIQQHEPYYHYYPKHCRHQKLSSSQIIQLHSNHEHQKHQQNQELDITVVIEDDIVIQDTKNGMTTIAPNNNNDDDIRQIESSSCPFYMTYPRYRIDLTSSPQKSSSSWFGGGMNNLLSMISLLPKEQIRKEMIDEISQRRKNSSANYKNDIKLDIQWYTNQDTLHAYTTLWNVASTLLTPSNNNTISSHDDNDYVIACCFPQAQSIVIQNWMEIFTWLFKYIMNDDSYDISSDQSYISVQYKDTYNVPRIHFRKDNSKNIYSQQHIQDNNQKNTDSESIDDHKDTNDDMILYDHDIITKRTQSWVKRILVEAGICPFTKSIKRSGQGLSDVNVPVGKIAYHTSQATLLFNNQNNNNTDLYLYNMLQLQSDIWNAIYDMIIINGPSGIDGISSILLAAPGYDNNFTIWSGPIFTILEAGIIASKSLQTIGVVCFHPLYLIPDGTTWPGFGQMHSVPRLQQWYAQQEQIIQQEEIKKIKQEQDKVIKKKIISNEHDDDHKDDDDDDDNDDNDNRKLLQQQQSDNNGNNCPLPLLSYNDIAAAGAFQRRTPHATINVLRADQLELAEKKRNSPQLYTRNINKLLYNIGYKQLENDLQKEREII